MVQQTEAPPEAVTVQIAPCGVCHLLFLISEARPTSPCHGADPLVALATLVVGPDGAVAGQWGFPAIPSARGEPVEPPLPPAPPEAEAVGAEHVPPLIEAPSPFEVVVRQINAFLRESDEDPADLYHAFLDAAATYEEASTAVGRLDAVRTLLRQLGENTSDLPP